MQSEDSNQSVLEILQRDLGTATRTIAGFGAFVYIIGYAVTAQRLAQYGVSTTELLDAQYFVAGIVPGLMIWITVFVVISALRFKLVSDNASQSIIHKWIWINFLVGIPIFLLIISGFISADWFETAWLSIYPAQVPIILLLGEISLWILIIGLKNGGFAKIIGMASNKSLLFRRVLIIGCGIHFLDLAVITFLTLVGIPLLGEQTYEAIPQAYGGGHSIIVELYANRQELPSELFAPQSEEITLAGSPTYTLPVFLIFRTSNEIIVDPIGDCDIRAWVLKADAVFATVELDEFSKMKLMRSNCPY